MRVNTRLFWHLLFGALAWGHAAQAARRDNGDSLAVLADAVLEWRDGDETGALTTLAAIDETRLPETGRAAYWVFRAEIAVDRGLPRLALQALERAAAAGGKGPRLDQLRAMAAADLGQWQVSLEAAQSLKRSLPIEQRAVGNALAGDALRGQRRLVAARAEYAEGLAVEPNDAACLAGLALVLPTEQLATLGASFSRLAEPIERLPYLTDRLLADERNDALEMLLAEAEKRSPGAATVGLCRVRFLAATGQEGRAATELYSLRPALPEGAWEEEWEEEYLALLERAGRLADAYRPGPDARRVFRRGGELLLAQEDPEVLTEWVERHLADDPADPTIAYFAGVALLQDEKYELAERELESGLARALDPGDRRNLLEALWETRYAAGRALAAYKKAEDRRAAFRFLVPLCLEDEDAQLLDSLIAAHREGNPSDPWLSLAQVELAWLRKDYRRVIEVAQAIDANGALSGNVDLADLARDRQARALVRLARFEEALAVARSDPEHARNPWYSAVVHIVQGEVEAAIGDIERCVEFGDEDLLDFLLDADAGPALESVPFGDTLTEWRSRDYDLVPSARLVLLESERAMVDRADVAAALEHAFQEPSARLLSTDSPWEIRLDDVWILVADVPGPGVSWPDGVPPASAPQGTIESLARQQAHYVLSAYPVSDAVDPARIRYVMGRLAAELVGPTCLAAYVPRGDRLLLADAELPAKLRGPKPFRRLGNPVPLVPAFGAGP